MKKSGSLAIEDDCIIMQPKITESPHSHKMPHILICPEPFELVLDGMSVRGRTALIAGGTMHSLASIPEGTIMLLVLPLTDLYFEIEKLTQGRYLVQEEYVELEALLERLEETGATYRNEIADSRIVKVVEGIRNGELLNLSVTEIAQRVNLSPSRLEHLFTKHAGFPLKHYLLLCRLKKALVLVDSDKSVTYSALESGFADSSHLAAAIKRMTGVSVSDVFKKI